MSTSTIKALLFGFLRTQARKTDTPYDDMAVDALEKIVESEILQELLEYFLGKGDAPDPERVRVALKVNGVTPAELKALEKDLVPSLRSLLP